MSRALRDAYRDCLLSLLDRHPDIICLDNDTGLFKAEHAAVAGEQYLNLGIAEHNLMGIAAGMAACGRMPFVNTMATFAASRALEAVKIDIAYNQLPVRIMATHGGLAAGHLGPTHHALEDLAVLRVLPGMTVVVPADAAATEAFVEQSLSLAGPLYVRLDRKPSPPLPDAPAPVIGQAQTLRQGGDAVLACCGPYPVLACLAAADVLAGHGIETTVLNLHTVRPLDTETLVEAARPAALVVTVEEHWRSGGLGGAVAEALAEAAPTKVLRLGMPDQFVNAVGNQEYLLTRYDITAERIVTMVCTGLDAMARIGTTHFRKDVTT
jgi:transketolase